MNLEVATLPEWEKVLGTLVRIFLSPGQSSLQEKEVLLTCLSSNIAVVVNIYDLGIITGFVK